MSAIIKKPSGALSEISLGHAIVDEMLRAILRRQSGLFSRANDNNVKNQNKKNEHGKLHRPKIQFLCYSALCRNAYEQTLPAMLVGRRLGTGEGQLDQGTIGPVVSLT